MLHRYHSSTYVFGPILDWRYKSMTSALLILRQMMPSLELPGIYGIAIICLLNSSNWFAFSVISSWLDNDNGKEQGGIIKIRETTLT